MILSLLFIIGAYLLGSIPFGLLLTKWKGLDDIRKTGSKSIGATNVLRSGGKGLAIATLLLDAGKGALAIFITSLVTDSALVELTGAAAVLGHVFPIWLLGKGGKGVATSLAVLLTIFWPAGVVACITWLVIFFTTKTSSLASLCAFFASTIWAFFFGGLALVTLCIFLTILIFYKHIPNIQRIIKGEELSFKSGDK